MPARKSLLNCLSFMIKAVLIDDESHCLDTLGILLNDYCPQVQVMERCVSAKDGLVAIEKHQPVIVFLDIEMPVMNGYDATIEIRRQEGATALVPIIAMTADVIDDSKERAFQAGMNDFVAKPVDMQELSRALRTWLKKAA